MDITRRAFTARALAAGGSLTALGPLLAACGGGDSEESGGPVQFWKFISENDDVAIKNVINRWNKANSDSQVKFRTFPFEEYLGAKLTTAFTAGKGPDVFWISPGAFLNYVNNGVAAPVDDIVDKSAYSKAAVDAVTVDGKMFAVPFEQEPVALYYRKDILDKEGIKPPATWEDMLAAAEALTGGKRKGIVIEPQQNAYQNFTWYPFLWSAGGEVVSADSKKSALRTPQAASAFDIWGQIMKRNLAPKKTQTGTADIGPLGRGEAAMQVCGFWAIGMMQHDHKDVEYGIAPLPIPAGGKRVTVYGGWTQMISAKSGRLDKAKEFTKWMWGQDKDFPRIWACENSTKFSPRKAVNEECGKVFDGPPHNVFTDEILPTARAEPRYPDQVVKAVGDGLQAAMFAGKSGEEAAALAADKIDSYLSSYQGAPLNPTA
jgi:multiple sugar transport system substrate-binding protein